MKKQIYNGEEFLIGTFQLGYRWVDVYANLHEQGGNFELVPDDKKNSRMVIGMNRDAERVYATLMHEAQEAIICDMECRFRMEGFANASDTCFFHYDHRQHTEVCSRVAWFLFKINKPFFAAHRKCATYRKKKAKK